MDSSPRSSLSPETSPVSGRQFFITVFRREIVQRALRTALVVGSILAAINHGPEILAFHLDGRRLFQIGLTYLVPYCVSSYAATMQELRHRNRLNSG